ncbi:hypothetical protein SNEBB_010152 [Seison nebaliae]|nr:hypothetical protein SNEBB_010152 [Seison nebaliae]
MILFLRELFYLFYIVIERITSCLIGLLKKYVKQIEMHQPIRYISCPLSVELGKRFSSARKILILDLDETLIHSMASSATYPPDFTVSVCMDTRPMKFNVYKRPHVDFFLDKVSEWYEVVIFTASMEAYGNRVIEELDNKRDILRRRYFRTDCTTENGGYTKNLRKVCEDLNRVLIIDNSPSVFQDFRSNAIPIKSWKTETDDTCLLDLLPFLDALRICEDVRSILSFHSQRMMSSVILSSVTPITTSTNSLKYSMESGDPTTTTTTSIIENGTSY